MADDQIDLFKPMSRIQQRLVRSAVAIEEKDPHRLIFQHSVLCQTGLPYRNPGSDARTWERRQGSTALQVSSGQAYDTERAVWVEVGLPFGPKPRLILAYLNTEALRTGSPEIEVEDSLTAFVKRIGLAAKGQNIRLIKDQLARLSAAQIRIAMGTEYGSTQQINTQVVTGFELWFPKDERQRVLWPSTVRLSLDYFGNLNKHAVPLDERAIAALSHTAMGLDVYAWLAYRLHLVRPSKGQFITWKALKDQFGWHYGRMDNFKRVFRQTLNQVWSQYSGARFELDGRGMTLHNSPPPIKGRVSLISKI